MRPLRLTISAFGSYSQLAEVDFTAYESGDLFLITGDTGAGKSTVFDAITYALYGDTAGGRHTKSFRSDYASPQTATFAEFTFSHKGHTYVVKRAPEYMRAKKTGEGLAKSDAYAQFSSDDGKLLTRIDAVDSAVRELLGLSREQFLQTVMIAQGDFRKILLAGSAERKKLFQSLFDTEKYYKFQELLKEEAGRDEALVTQLTNLLQQELSGVETPNDDEGQLLSDLLNGKDFDKAIAALQAYCARCEDGLKAATREKEETQSKLDKCNEALSEGKIFNKLLDRLKECREKCEHFAAMQGEKEEKRGRLKRAKEADTLAKTEQSYLDTDAKLRSLREQEATCTARIEQLSIQLSQATEKCRSTVPLRERLTVQKEMLTKLNSALPILRGNKVKMQKAALETTRLEEKRITARTLQLEFITLNERFMLGQAGVLADGLTEGVPCPVCGATHHPSKAHLLGDTPTQESLKQAEKRAAQAQTEFSRTSETLAVLNAEIEAAKDSALQLAGETDEALLEAQIQRIQTEYTINEQTVNSATKEYDEVNSALSSAKMKLEFLSESISKAQDEYSKAYALFEASLIASTFADKTEYYDNKLAPVAIKTLENELSQYDSERLKAETTLAETQRSVEGRTRVSIDEIEKEVVILKEQYAHVSERLERLNAILVIAHKAADNAEKLIEQRRQALERRNLTDDLSRAANGRLSDKMKLTFEAYVQQYYFRLIIAAANMRLSVLTEGAFVLRCMEGAKNGRSQSGLDIEVYDNATGRWRDSDTLSGGETFQASLALALGLADVVQSRSGGVRVEAMFIDEGFGTLDEQALAQAVSTLARLAGANRLIGIISHVAELKRRIDKKIVVKKTLQGSFITQE